MSSLSRATISGVRRFTVAPIWPMPMVTPCWLRSIASASNGASVIGSIATRINLRVSTSRQISKRSALGSLSLLNRRSLKSGGGASSTDVNAFSPLGPLIIPHGATIIARSGLTPSAGAAPHRDRRRASDLTVGAATMRSLTSQVGLRAEHRFDLGEGSGLAGQVSVVWEHQFPDTAESLQASYQQDLTPRTFTGDALPRDAAVIDVKLTGQAARRVQYFLGFDVKLDGAFSDETAAGGLRIRF